MWDKKIYISVEWLGNDRGGCEGMLHEVAIVHICRMHISVERLGHGRGGHERVHGHYTHEESIV